MSTQFITNQDRLLVDVVNNILPSSEKLYFLVGYFYFSGFEEVYKNVIDKEIKILVGLEIEKDIANKIREFEVIDATSAPRGKIRDNYYNSFVELFNDTGFFDTKDKQDAFRLFLEKIKNGSLEIRKTEYPNHAKLYIFENKKEFSQGEEFPGTVITGSSNFTRSGLRGNFEINVVSRHPRNYSEAFKIFKDLWDSAVRIVDKDNLNEFLINVVSKIWLDKLPKPFLLYVRVLEEYFSDRIVGSLRLPSEITKNKYINMKYQEDAIKRALDILRRHNGVIIADVVGLGKSIIASAVAHNLNLKTIIIAPPHLMWQWEDYHNEFEFHARIYSSGKIEKALQDSNNDEEKLIIIDEAHKYRNAFTEDYANLHKLCQRNKVMLLTATPFNNQPQDVFSLVKMFQIPTRTTLQTVDNLSFQFKKLVHEYKMIKEAQRTSAESPTATKARIKLVADEIRNMLSPLVIRRSRLDLDAIDEYKKDLIEQKISFPEVKEPKLLEYELGSLSGLYQETLQDIAPEDEKNGFIGARYKPTSYIKDFEKYKERIAKEMGVDENLLKQTQVNLAKFMKRLLVRRFESSISAFQITLNSMINQSEKIKNWYDNLGKVPIYKKGNLPNVDSLLEAIGEDMDDDLKDVLLEKELQEHIENGLWLIDKKEILKSFIEDVEKDIKILKTIREKWFGRGFPEDPKLIHFEKVIEGKIDAEPNRKIVVFTEFADTANYIYKGLNDPLQVKDKLRVFKYTGKDASESNKQIIRENFDAGFKNQKNNFDVLIATDAISEGFNLHRAGAIFNYDIPYNPTRVIQRVGRINRINKKVFDELFIFNYFPTAIGEKENHIKQVSTLKIAMIHALFGEDTKVLTKDEELESYFAKQIQDALKIQEELSPEVRYENFIRNLRAKEPGIIEQALILPKRCRIKRLIKKERSGVIIFGKKGGEYAFKYGAKKGECQNLGVSDAFRLFESTISENSEKTTKGFDEIYDDAAQRLFSKKKEVAMDRGKTDAIDKVKSLKEKLPGKKDYFDDLLYVLKELDALPDRYARLIRGIDLKNLNEDIKKLEQEVPHRYLVNIIEREKQVDEGKESLILSEELI